MDDTIPKSLPEASTDTSSHPFVNAFPHYMALLLLVSLYIRQIPSSMYVKKYVPIVFSFHPPILLIVFVEPLIPL